MQENSMQSAQPSETLLRLPAVAARTGLGKSQLYALMKRREFPQCVKLGPRASGWVASEIDAWIAERIRLAREVRR